jgi:C-terminal processing protease CtpA/Prc
LLIPLAALAVCSPLALAPATAFAQQSGQRSEDRPSLGIAFWPHRDGIEVNNVVSGSSAHKAGIRSGMIITQINGTALKDKSISQIERMVVELTGQITLTMIDGSEITLEKTLINQSGS